MPGNPEALSILILNGDLPVFPGWGGIEYLNTTRLAQMAQRVGLVSLVHSREQQEKKQSLADAGVVLYLWESPNLIESSSTNHPRPTLFRRVGKAVLSVLLTWPYRPQDTLIQDFAFQHLAASTLKALSSDHWQVLIVVQSRSARWLDYLPRFPVSVLVMHDVRALLYERRAQIATSWVEKFLSSFEAGLYRRFERNYCRQYDLIVTVSKADECWVRKNYRPKKLVTIPIPVDGDYFKPLPSVREAPAQILFTGMMNHPPNIDAACFFARQVFPRIKAAIPEAEFWIVGRDPSPEVRKLGHLQGVIITGFVPDIRPYIAKATVFVVPLRFGSGMRQKILEAWGMQKCVVSTKVGAEGLDYQDGVNIFIADDVQTIAEKVIQAIQDLSLRDRVRVKGRDLILTQHHPSHLARQYYQAMDSIVQEKQRKDEPMRVVIDMRWMHPGEAGGIEILARSFLNQLLKLDGFNLYHLLVPPEVKYNFDLRYHPNFRISVAKGPGHYGQKLWKRGTQFFHHLLRMGDWRSAEVEELSKARALNAEIALSFPGYMYPDLYALSNVLIVPDIQHEFYPEFFLPQHLEERRRIYTDSIKRADHLCAISEFTRQTLIERLGVSPQRVTTTHLAADPIFHPQSVYRGNPGKVLRKYDLKMGDYLLFPGNTWPHKNHGTALQALRILHENYGLDRLLVCTGSLKEAHPLLLNIIHDLHLDGYVRFLGYCPMTDMPALYEGAAALVFPSLFEGFGIPLLEAMWCDCPIVCSNATSLPEIAGDAALPIDPHSPEELAAAIHRILTDESLRRVLIERGRQRVEKFSWLNFTLEIVRILNQVREMHYA